MKKVNDCQRIYHNAGYVFEVSALAITLFLLFTGGYTIFEGSPIFSTKPLSWYQEGGFCYFVSTFVTTWGLMETDVSPNYVLAKLRTRGGDLSKRWFVEFSAIELQTGKLKRKQVVCPAKFETKKQREIWANETCKKINSLLIKGYAFGEKEPEPLIIPEETPKAIQQLLQYGIDNSLRKKTRETYKTAINKFQEYLGKRASKDISVITPVLVTNFQKFLLDQGLENSTVNNILLKTKTVFSHLQKTGFIESQPIRYTKLTEEESESNEYFNKTERREIEIYLQENKPQLYLFTRFIYYSFIRPGELIQLKFSDIDFERGTITVSGKVSKNRKTLTIPIHPELLKLIPRIYPPNYYIFGKKLLHSNLRCATNTAYNTHRDVLKELGYDELNYTLYSWKHTGAVNAYYAGTDLKTLQFLLRHSTVQHTEIYLRKLRVLTQDIELKAW